MIETIRDALQLNLNLTPEMQVRLVNTLLTILVLILLRLVLLRVVNPRFEQDTRALYNWRKLTEYVIVILGLILIGRLWLEGVQSVATYFGLLSAGVASGVLLTMRYFIAPRQRRNSEQAIWEVVLRAFGQHADIDFAYETYREYRQWREGKMALLHQEGDSAPAGSGGNRD